MINNLFSKDDHKDPLTPVKSSMSPSSESSFMGLGTIKKSLKPSILKSMSSGLGAGLNATIAASGLSTTGQ